MMYMIEKKYTNEDLEIELTSFIDDKQNVWFRGKEIAEILSKPIKLSEFTLMKGTRKATP